MSRPLVQVARFFLVFPVVPAPMLAGFGLATAVGVFAISYDLANAGGIMLPVWLLQLFAVSSGFRVPARRGHYDLLLTSGAGRSVIVCVHWTMSAGPGLLSWVTLILVERANGGATLTEPEATTAALLVSTVPWALTIPLPRLSGAIVCLLSLAAAAAVPPLREARVEIDGAWLACVVAIAVGSVGVVLMWVRKVDFPLEPGQ